MSTFTGRLALSVYRKSAFPLTQDGMHIVFEKMDGIASEFHLCIFAEGDEAAAREYAENLKEAEAAVARGESPPETPLPGDMIEPDSVQRVIVKKPILIKMVAQLRADEVPPPATTTGGGTFSRRTLSRRPSRPPTRSPRRRSRSCC